MLRPVLFFLLAVIVAAAIYSFIAVGHSYPSLGMALPTGAVAGLIFRAGDRSRAPRVGSAILFLVGVGVSHRLPGVPGTGPHRLAFDVQYLAVFLLALVAVRAVRRTRSA